MWITALFAGAKAGLLGKSTKSLALFLAERHHAHEVSQIEFAHIPAAICLMCNDICSLQAVIIHERTGGFLRWVLLKYLPEYDWHSLVGKGSQVQSVVNDSCKEAFLLNPHDFGWPMNRPRLYTVGTLRGTCHLKLGPDQQPGLISVTNLFEKCTLDCRSLFVAPQDP